MEAKSVAITLLLLSLVVGLEAKSCCPSTTARNTYNVCRLTGASRETCAKLSGCKIISGSTCPDGWTNDILENTGDDAVKQYCKLGCAFSVCAIIQKSGDDVDGTVKNCHNACSAFCTKSSINAVEAA